MKTILITGCSSGFGRDIARHFLEHDWKVVATKRTPQERVLPESDRLRVLPLDVTDTPSIRRVIDAAGPIDAPVNNAAIGAAFPVELGSMKTTRQLFETNTFGTMAMTQAVLPQFRERDRGVIVNISSSTTLKPLPLLAFYRASKAAVNAFTQCLSLEVTQFGVRVHLVLPGRAPETSFSASGRQRMEGMEHEAYADVGQGLFDMFNNPGSTTRSQDAVWRAVTDATTLMQLFAGVDAIEWAEASDSASPRAD